MDITELGHIMDLVRTVVPGALWDTDDDGNVVILTYKPLEV